MNARDKVELLSRLAEVERLIKRRDGPDISQLSQSQLMEWRRWNVQFSFNKIGMTEDQIASETYQRIANATPLRSDIELALFGTRSLPIDCLPEDAERTYQLTLDRAR